MQANETDPRGGQAFAFEIVGERADGTRAGGSNRHEEHGVNLILAQQGSQLPR